MARTNYDDFIRRWWKRKFPTAKPPIWSSAITCADASELLRAFEEFLKRKAVK